MRKLILLVSALTAVSGFAQIDINQNNQVYTQDFDGLSNTGTTNDYSTLPVGWSALEVGSSANTIYRASDGYYSGGDLYSYGTINSTDRALGTIGSGSNDQVYFATAFVNQTTDVLNTVDITFDAELWRIGNPARSTGPDTLRFAYAVNPLTIDDNASFTDVASLYFVSPADPTGPTQLEADGNLPANRSTLTGVLNVSIAPQDTLWIRWRDDNSSSYDDGMGVDNLSVEFSLQNTVNTSMYNVIDAMDTYYTEDFDGMVNDYSAVADFTTLPNGWYAHEVGGNANQLYQVAYGEYAGGNLYSYGDSASTERAFGSVGSGSVTHSHRGVAYINTTSTVIENVEVSFTGEMWRQGRPDRTTGPDTLHFSYAINANDIAQGAYQDLDLLNFYSPVTNGTLSTPMNGNAIENKTDVLAVIGNLSLQPMDTLWVRWTDFNSASFDDGLAIDDFSIAAISTASILNVEFANSSTTFEEDQGIVSVPLYVHNKNNFLTQVEVKIVDAGNVNLTTDLDIVESIVTFPVTGIDSIAYFQFNIKNSEPFENQEYFVLEISNPNNAFLGNNIYDTIYINNYDYPLLPISTLKGVDVNGIADDMGLNVHINGVVHGVNYNSLGGIDFYVLEDEKGMNVYSMGNTFSYLPVEGDEVNVWGQISQFRGLIRMEQLDSIELISAANSLEIPSSFEEVNETNEGMYIQLDSLQLIPSISVWPSNQNVYAKNLATGDTVELFIGANTDLAQTPAPLEMFSVVGIGSQYATSTSSPFMDGYRLMLIGKSNMSVLDLKNEIDLNLVVYPNPSNSKISFKGLNHVSEVSIYSLDGRKVLTKEIQSNETLNIDSLDNATYILRLNNQEGVFTTTLIKQ